MEVVPGHRCTLHKPWGDLARSASALIDQRRCSRLRFGAVVEIDVRGKEVEYKLVKVSERVVVRHLDNSVHPSPASAMRSRRS